MLPAYRLCLEHPLDASLEDALSAFRWLVQELGSPMQIVVGGESAGGGLALRLLCSLRDSGAQLPVAGVLLSPWTDLAMTGESLTKNAASEAIFSTAFLQHALDNLVGVADPRDPRLSPLYADLTGLPPLLIHVSNDEVFRDDSIRLAERARTSGMVVTLRVFPGLWHVFQANSNLPEGRWALNDIGQFVRRRFATQSKPENKVTSGIC